MWINPETLELSAEEQAGYVRVSETQCPLTERLEKAVIDGAELVDGDWRQKWSIQPLTAADLAQVHAAEAANAAYRLAQVVHSNNSAYEAAIAQLTSDYPAAEIATWERQSAEAVAWGADPAALTPWITMAASARALDRDEYLARTLAKVTAFAGASAYLTGRRQGIDDQIRAATTAEELAAVVIDYTLPGA